jgi:D-alanyl-D-alanine carboxypeptidase
MKKERPAGVQLASVRAPAVERPTEKPVERKTITAQPTVAKKAPEKEKGKPVATAENWGVQVGAFGSRAAGDRAVAQALRQAPGLLRGAKRNVLEVKTPEGKTYRARLTGMNEQAARKACAELSRTGHRCVAVGPNQKI